MKFEITLMFKKHIWGRHLMLELKNIDVSYGDVKTLYGVSLTAKAGEITCLLGRNGAGKTTSMKSIMRLLPLTAGSILINGEDVSAADAHEIPRKRVGYIPQGRRLFAELSVSENIEIGLMACGEGKQTREWVLDIFPRLRERLKQRANTLSGGEQQMLATARALCVKPKVLWLDEPTEGLQPSMIAQIRDVIIRMKDEGVAIVLIEQRVDAILAIADQAVFIENGKNIETLSGDDLRAHPEKLRQNLGV
jgi:branched-chain amino acid transport system ATP-binding protein